MLARSLALVFVHPRACLLDCPWGNFEVLEYPTWYAMRACVRAPTERGRPRCGMHHFKGACGRDAGVPGDVFSHFTGLLLMHQ